MSSLWSFDTLQRFNSFDYVVLAIVLLSVLLGMLRGMVKEVLSLVNWVIAFWLANRYGFVVAENLGGLIETESLNDSMRMLLGCSITFLAAMLTGGIVTSLLGKVVTAAGLGFSDRTLGAIFGLGRGLFIVFVVVIGAGFTALPQQPFWRDAVLAPFVEDAVRNVKPYLPQHVAKWVRY